MISIFFPNILFSQIQNTSYNSLNTHSSSRILAMGGDVISIFDNDVSLANLTPSLLNKKMDKQIAFNFVDYLVDINFISLLAASNLISRFKYDSQKLVKLRKEDQEYLASNPSLFERILAERQGDVTIMDIDSKHMSNLLKALKKAQNKLGKGA